jgi:16S rRNA (adenine1518-N6/adenine1519-N6)-dimethyltransferase
MNPEELTSPKEVKNILQKYDLRLKRRLGQNFLTDKNILNKIIKAADLSSRDIVIEIGSGLGTLTQGLAKKAGKVTALEIDKKLHNISRKILQNYKNVELVQGNILKIDLNSLIYRLLTIDRQPFKVISNLPYYIATSILTRLLENKNYFKVILISLQKEVAERMIARPGTKDYGILSLAVQYHTEPEILFSISRGSFFPHPQVDSSFVRLKVLSKPKVKVKDEKFFFSLVKAAFSQRRKTLFNALKDKLNLERETLLQTFKKVGLDPKRRAETLSLEEFAYLTNSLS